MIVVLYKYSVVAIIIAALRMVGGFIQSVSVVFRSEITAVGVFIEFVAVRRKP